MSTATPTRSSGVEVAKGIATCFVLDALYFGIACLLIMTSGSYVDFSFTVGVVLIGGFGLLQLLYAIPLILTLRRKGRPNFALGMIVGASVGVLLSATCWGTIWLGR